MATSLEDLYQDPVNFTRLTNDELFAIPYAEVVKLQLHHFKQRFALLRDKIPTLQRLADDVEIDAVNDFDDLVRLTFPLGMYKSYSTNDVENGRYDNMTRWLQAFTANNLSGVNLDGCESLDDWLDRLQAQTPMRPSVSSGASGKVSVWPRGTVEEQFVLEFFVRRYAPYPGKPGIPGLDLRKNPVPIVCPFPMSHGRHNVPVILELLRNTIYKGKEDWIITQGNDSLSAGKLWLTGKLRRAEELGEKLELSARDQKLVDEMAAEKKDSKELWDRFIERAVVQQRGKTVVYFGFWVQLYQIAQACIERGVKIEWAADSVLPVGGGKKGFGMPDDFLDVINGVLPFRYPGPNFREIYAMNESTGLSVSCSEGFFHPVPWGIQHLSDPDNGESLPRTGTQRGRMLMLDLLPSTHWCGTASGDEVTVHWDGGCKCGRQGPYLDTNIQPLAESRGGNDKISCSKTAQAYQRLEEFIAR